MAAATIPVDLRNPGQVFACLGLLEAAEILCGPAEGGFTWNGAERFVLQTEGAGNPIESVLAFLTQATIHRLAPCGWVSPAKKDSGRTQDDEVEHERNGFFDSSDTVPAARGERMALPIRLVGGNHPTIQLDHWADGSSRSNFKLYSGNRSADQIAGAMLLGVRDKPKKGQPVGASRTKGVVQLWEEQRAALIERPFHVLTPMGGSFNFDPRGAWTAIDTGYSPNDQNHSVAASPVVEFLAAWGLQNARPLELQGRRVRYAAWGVSLPLILARAALFGGISALPLKRFCFHLGVSGKNKIVNFADVEPRT